MHTGNSSSVRVIGVMNENFNFSIDPLTDIRPESTLTCLHIEIDVERNAFYQDHFKLVCRQMQLLAALGKRHEARKLAKRTRRNLSIAIQLAAKCTCEIFLYIAQLDECINIESAVQ